SQVSIFGNMIVALSQTQAEIFVQNEEWNWELVQSIELQEGSLQKQVSVGPGIFAIAYYDLSNVEFFGPSNGTWESLGIYSPDGPQFGESLSIDKKTGELIVVTDSNNEIHVI